MDNGGGGMPMVMQIVTLRKSLFSYFPWEGCGLKKKIRYGCELTASAVTITLLAFLKVLLKVAAAMMECRHLVVLSSICVQIFGFSAQAVHLASAFDQVKIKLHPVPTLSPVV